MSDPIALEDRARIGARRMSPSAGRNRAVIGRELASRLPHDARVLEIASGTGEHALHMATLRPDLVWQPTDPDAESRASQDGWRLDAPDAMRPSLPVSVTDPHWWGGLDPVDAIFCANMIHIAPWQASEGLAAGASHLLSSGGALYLYGPFLKRGHGPQSNRDFDATLRNRNPNWGVRELADVKRLFAENGLQLNEAVTMPANNDLLVFGH